MYTEKTNTKQWRKQYAHHQSRNREKRTTEQLQVIFDSNWIHIEQKPTGQIRCGNKSIRKRILRWHNAVTNQKKMTYTNAYIDIWNVQHVSENTFCNICTYQNSKEQQSNPVLPQPAFQISSLHNNWDRVDTLKPITYPVIPIPINNMRKLTSSLNTSS